MDSTTKLLDKLAANVDVRAKIPRGFGFWSTSMVIMWLRQHQKKKPPQKRR